MEEYRVKYFRTKKSAMEALPKIKVRYPDAFMRKHATGLWGIWY